jgi:hypothetical protein
MDLTIDACGLIDLYDQDPSLLQLIVQTIGRVIVPAQVLAEVDGLTRAAAEALGLEIVDPTDAQLDEASGPGGRLSFADRISLITARDRGLSCATSDSQLHTACLGAGVPHLEALDPLIGLVRAGVLDPAACLAAARGMRDRNGYITTRVFQIFEKRLRTAARRSTT